MRDYYQVLGVSPNARAEEITRACRQLARRYHPDISGDDQAGAFRDAPGSYEVLRGPAPSRDDDSARRERGKVVEDLDDWLTDDIAIDFPAIDEVLDRMRAAFFGPVEAVSPLSAEVRLTPREAFFGAVVPVRVPVRGVCGACGGRGESWLEPCPRCDGTGAVLTVHPLLLDVPAGVGDGTLVRIGVTSRAAPTTVVEVRIVVT